MQSLALLLALGGAICSTNAAPTSRERQAAVEERQDSLFAEILSELNALNPSATGAAATSQKTTAVSALLEVTATATPTSPEDAISALSSVFLSSPTPSNLFAAVAELIEAGLTSDDANVVLELLELDGVGENSFTNINLKSPTPSAYPTASSSDAPYDLTEAVLREAIYIPSSYTYGEKKTIILVPGTGSTGYYTFIGSYIPLLQGSADYDPVWLNIPGYLYGDAQTNAEYVAYAINYLYGINGNAQVSVIAWSQGNIDAQWAYKYWPSTNARTANHIGISPDYHGTTEADIFVDLAALGVAAPPSILQQAYDSNLITTLRADGGDYALVPTTTVYSSFYDEIVSPQSGTGASAYLLGNSSIVSNNDVQLVCPDTPAGSFFTHEGMLYNALGYALAIDAFTNGGPGLPSRLDLTTVCADYLSPGLDLDDLLLTENTLVIAVLEMVLYPADVDVEPAIKSYALE